MKAKAKPVKITAYDTADYLRDETDIVMFLEEILKDCDAETLVDALGVVARARGMTKIAKATGLNREGLYRALSKDKSPSFNTVFRVMQAVGLRVAVKESGKKVATKKTVKIAA